MLAIALIPSLVLLLVGLVISGYLVGQGVDTYRWADNLQAAVTPATRIVTDLQIERWLSLVQIGGEQVPHAQLSAQRGKVDADLVTLRTARATVPDLAYLVLRNGTTADAPWNQLGAVRQQVDSDDISLLDTYTYYDQLLAPIANYTASVAADAPSSAITDAQLTAASLYSATEDVARANALSFSAAIHGGMSGTEFAEYARQVGGYQSSLDLLLPRMTRAEQRDYATLIASPAWQQLSSVQDALSASGPALTSARTPAPPQVSQLDWQNDTLQVTATMLGLFGSHFRYAAGLAVTDGRTTLVRALIAGALILLVGIAVLVIALRMSNGVSRRLGRLRRETLDLAEQHLPRLVRRLRDGNGVDVDSEVPRLDHGNDEIGEVAEAFNMAQHTAISAAVREARTRHGTNVVFLNIAHRSQAVAHRQLNVLDRAEHRQDDPEQIRLLFQLDHLATRARRNAENLIVLGGRQPSRQWRDAVPMRDVIRSAIAETEHFARIRITGLPQIAVAGRAAGDVVHLFAELLDNATAFAPPDAHAEVHGNSVGRGVVIEIEDQGLGIPPAERDAMNAKLLDPPDYGVMALSSDARLGMFVVARLAARHGIRVTLTESVYGGTRVIVLLPSDIVEESDQPVTADDGIVVAPAIPDWPRHEPAEPAIVDPDVVDAVEDMVVDGIPATERTLPGFPVEQATPGITPTAVTEEPFVPRPVGERLLNRQPGSPPPLPHRRRQAHLVPQLATPNTSAEDNGSRSADQTRSAIAAFQHGTRQGRDDDTRGDTRE